MGKANNWQKYNTALVQRGSIKFLLEDKIEENWYEEGGRCGGKFSDYAIQAFQTIRALIKGTLRSTQGFIKSLFEAKGIQLEVSDYSTV